MFSTFKKTKKINLLNYQIEYRMLKKELFFGYIKLENGLFIATPEKALFDLIYLSRFGKIYFDINSIDLDKINAKKLNKMIEKFIK